MIIDYFRVYMPYGIYINPKGEIAPFNRGYKPLGQVNYIPGADYYNSFSWFKYHRTTNRFFDSLAHKGEIRETADGYRTLWFYDDASIPKNFHYKWPEYITRLKQLTKLKPVRSNQVISEY